MGYDFHPVNDAVGTFHMGAFLWPYFLDKCGAYFICVHNGPKWYFVDDIDDRMLSEDDNVPERYPRIIENSGFPVTAEESLVLARIASNWSIIQRSLPTPSEKEDDDFLKPCYQQIWPRKVREDWTDTLESFVEWAEKSGGFTID